jgi:hypothetical protein
MAAGVGVVTGQVKEIAVKLAFTAKSSPFATLSYGRRESANLLN